MRLEQQARSDPLKSTPMGRSKVTSTSDSNKGAEQVEDLNQIQVQDQDQDEDNQQQQQRQHQQHLDDESAQSYRPKRKATNAHIFRYLQTRNPGRLEEEDLKKALEASLEECPDFDWPAEDTASCSSSDQSNAPSASSNSSSMGAGCNSNKNCANTSSTKNRRLLGEKSSTGHRTNFAGSYRRGLKSSSSAMQLNHHHSCNCHINQHNNYHYHPYQNNHPAAPASHHNGTSKHGIANVHSCPMISVHNRYKPVGKKNIYNEADFFHDGIMEYIEFELLKKGVIQSSSI